MPAATKVAPAAESDDGLPPEAVEHPECGHRPCDLDVTLANRARVAERDDDLALFAPHIRHAGAATAQTQADYAGAFTLVFLAIAASLFVAFAALSVMEERPLTDRRPAGSAEDRPAKTPLHRSTIVE